MAAVALLTVLALLGVFLGCGLGQSKMLPAHLAAAGGGLLFGIAMFWLLPEIADSTGWWLAAACAVAFAVALLSIDALLDRVGHSPRHGMLGPLVIATALHSFLDGWSVRAVGVGPLTSTAVTVGLALHKVPEGVALGWLTRRNTGSAMRAGVIASAVECVTLLGGFCEPRAAQSGVAAFGRWWSPGVLAIVTGSFFFLAWHTFWPERKKLGIVPVFGAGLAIAGVTAWVAGRG